MCRPWIMYMLMSPIKTSSHYCAVSWSTAAVAEWFGHRIMLTLRRAEGREFDPRPGQYSRMSFSSDQVTGTVFPHLNMPFLPNSKFFENIVLVGKH